MVVVIVDDEASPSRNFQRQRNNLFLDNDMGVLEDGVWLAKELVKYYTSASPIAQVVVHSMNVVAAEATVDIISDSYIIGEAYVVRVPANTLIAEY